MDLLTALQTTKPGRHGTLTRQPGKKTALHRESAVRNQLGPTSIPGGATNGTSGHKLAFAKSALWQTREGSAPGQTRR